jgi:hypothetical protein
LILEFFPLLGIEFELLPFTIFELHLDLEILKDPDPSCDLSASILRLIKRDELFTKLMP